VPVPWEGSGHEAEVAGRLSRQGQGVQAFGVPTELTCKYTMIAIKKFNTFATKIKIFEVIIAIPRNIRRFSQKT
jgi:hypothetical protein